jgi:uncharacterized protein YjbI with pentapeptide repeats
MVLTAAFGIPLVVGILVALRAALVVTRRRSAATDEPAVDEAASMAFHTEQLRAGAITAQVAALESLERLAQRHDHLRDTVVWTICDRLIWQHKPALQRAALQVLATHLRPSDPARYWGPQIIDLSLIRLSKLDLRGCAVHTLRLRDTTITGPLCLEQIHIAGDADLTGIVLRGPVDISAATIEGHLDLRGADSREPVLLTGTVVHGDARLAGAAFWAGATFSGCVVDGSASFTDPRHRPARFEGPVRFTESHYGSGDHRRAQYHDTVDLDGACITSERP